FTWLKIAQEWLIELNGLLDEFQTLQSFYRVLNQIIRNQRTLKIRHQEIKPILDLLFLLKNNFSSVITLYSENKVIEVLLTELQLPEEQIGKLKLILAENYRLLEHDTSAFQYYSEALEIIRKQPQNFIPAEKISKAYTFLGNYLYGQYQNKSLSFSGMEKQTLSLIFREEFAISSLRIFQEGLKLPGNNILKLQYAYFLMEKERFNDAWHILQTCLTILPKQIYDFKIRKKDYEYLLY